MNIPFVEDRSELLRWAVCGAVAVFLHGAVAAAMIHAHDADEAAQPTAAMVINLAPFPVSPPDSHTELPPGPEQIEAAASPQVPVKEIKDEVEKKVETEQPQEVQSEVAPAVEPEVTMATLPPKPDPQMETPQENRLPAPETTATQMSNFELAEVAAAPVQGQATTENSNAIPTWRSAVVALLERNKRYPAEARDARGIAQIEFSIDRQGRVTRSQILSSSGSAALDHEAFEMVRRSQPFPPPPATLLGAEIRLSMPVRFNMR